MSKQKSPLRYPGGKTRACRTLYDVVSNRFSIDECTHVLSPFFGGGSFELYLRRTHPHLRIVANDKFVPLYHFWKEAAADGARLCAEIEAVRARGVDKAEFGTLQREIMGKRADSLAQATDFFVINRCSFSGATLSGGYSASAARDRFTASSVERVRRLDLTAFEIHNEDFEPFLERHYTDESLLFLDPPYYLAKSTLYGKDGDMHEGFDHARLASWLCDNDRRWVLTYNDCPYIRELYKDCEIIEASWSYGMNKSKRSSELIIFPPPSPCAASP